MVSIRLNLRSNVNNFLLEYWKIQNLPQWKSSDHQVKAPIFNFTADSFIQFITRIKRRWWSNSNLITLIWGRVFSEHLRFVLPCSFCFFSLLILGHINCVRISIIELSMKQNLPQSQKWKFWIRVVNSCVTHALTSLPEVTVQDADKPNDLSVETDLPELHSGFIREP